MKKLLSVAASLLILTSCSVSKSVPKGSYLVNAVVTGVDTVTVSGSKSFYVYLGRVNNGTPREFMWPVTTTAELQRYKVGSLKRVQLKK